MASQAQVIERIEKLYALAQGGATEGEAKAAIAMAQKLMGKYGIKESRVNKNRYKSGTSAKKPKSSEHYKTYDWDEYKQKTNQRKKSEDKSSKSDDGWERAYRNKTFGQTGIVADIIRETEKAYLLNIYMDESRYGLKEVKVSIWYPKSQVVFRSGNRWIVKRDLIMVNLRRNMDWLKQHHEAFLKKENQFFWFKSVE